MSRSRTSHPPDVRRPCSLDDGSRTAKRIRRSIKEPPMTRIHLTRRAAIVGAAVAAVAAGGAAAALATSSTSGDVYQGCLNHNLGALYNVKGNPSAPPRCLSPDTLVKRNPTGPAGAPRA